MPRPASQEQRILLDLRRQIVSGQLAPGNRLPTRIELQKTYGATPPVQSPWAGDSPRYTAPGHHDAPV